MTILTQDRNPVRRKFQIGSLTGAVASQRVTEALKGSLRMVGNHSKRVKAEVSLTARLTSRAGTKVGLSDAVVNHGCANVIWIKANTGINVNFTHNDLNHEVC